MIRKVFSRSNIANILLTFFVLVCIVQGYDTWKNYAHVQLYDIFKYGSISSVQRSGIFKISYSTAENIWWLDAYLPKDVPVVLPPDIGTGIAFTDQNMMQFYLLPRNIWLCDPGLSPQCREDLANPATVVLVFNQFPPPESVPGKIFIPVPEAIHKFWLDGVYLPASMVNQLKPPTNEQLYTPGRIPLNVPFIDILILVSLFFLGTIFTSLMINNLSWLDIGILSFPIAIGLLSWIIFITSYFGIPITRITISIWFFSLAVIGLILHKFVRKRWLRSPAFNPGQTLRTIFIEDRIALVIGAAVVIWFGLSAVISIGRGYSVFDDIANWAVKGYAIAFQHSIWAGELRGGHILAYPLNTQLSIAIFRLFDGDLLPGSKMIFTILTGSLLLGCYKFLKQAGVSTRMALMGLLILITTPLIFLYSTVGMANLPFTSYLVLGILWSLDGVFKNKNDSILIGGSLLAFAAWTRPEGIGFGGVLIIAILLVEVFMIKIKPALKQWIVFISPLVLFPTTWLLLLGAREMARDQIGGTLGSFLPQILHGNLHLDYLLSIIKYTFSYFTSWQKAGYFWLIFILLGTIILFMIKPTKEKYLPLIICLLITILFPFGMFYTAAFSAGQDFIGFLDYSYDRAMLPALVLLVFLGTMTMGFLFSSADNKEI